MGIGLLRQQLFNRGRGLRTVRALHIAELDNRHRSLRRSLGGAVHAFFQLGAGIFKGLRAEGQDVARNGVFAVSAHQQAIRVRALRVGDNNRDLRQSGHLGGTNLVHLPRDGGIVAKHLEQERVDRVFAGQDRLDFRGGRKSPLVWLPVLSGEWAGFERWRCRTTEERRAVCDGCLS